MLSSSFRRSGRIGTFFIFQFEIARMAIRTDVKYTEMAMMFRLIVFLSELTVTEIEDGNHSVLQLLLRR